MHVDAFLSILCSKYIKLSFGFLVKFPELGNRTLGQEPRHSDRNLKVGYSFLSQGGSFVASMWIQHTKGVVI